MDMTMKHLSMLVALFFITAETMAQCLVEKNLSANQSACIERIDSTHEVTSNSPDEDLILDDGTSISPALGTYYVSEYRLNISQNQQSSAIWSTFDSSHELFYGRVDVNTHIQDLIERNEKLFLIYAQFGRLLIQVFDRDDSNAWQLGELLTPETNISRYNGQRIEKAGISASGERFIIDVNVSGEEPLKWAYTPGSPLVTL